MAEFETKYQELKKKHLNGIIVGLKQFGGKVIPRVDIDVLMVNEPEIFNLMILALRELKKKPESDIMGWFQMASIHGFPLTLWNGVKGKKPTPTPAPGSANNDGYCPHGLRTFGTWHRSYMVMLEQSLFVQMVEIAKQYENKDVQESYLEAVQRFRLPYWDYYKPRGGAVIFPGIIRKKPKVTEYAYDYSMPKIFTEERLMARMVPDNELSLVKNPFFNFCFGGRNGDLRDNEWDYMIKANGSTMSRRNTTRHPFPKDPDPQDVIWDNPQRLNTSLNEMRMDSNRVVLDMMSGAERWNVFDDFVSAGENEPKKKPAEATAQGEKDKDPIGDFMNNFKGSLEGVHNMYHVICGGFPGPAGHMGKVPTAAFDPVFWFHHGQIERLLSLWQSIYGKQTTGWFKNKSQAEEALVPFIKEIKQEDGAAVSRNVFWTSEDLKSCEEAFGYTYEDIKGSVSETIASINEAYQWSVPKTRDDPFKDPPARMKPVDLSKVEFFQVPGPKPSSLLSDDVNLPDLLKAWFPDADKKATNPAAFAPTTDIWDWQVGDRVRRLALNGSFAIAYHVMDQDERGKDLYKTSSISPSLAGLTYIFAAPKEVCSTCARDAADDRIAQNAVSITSQLMDYIKDEQLESLEPEHVVPFLKERLRWRIIDSDGNFRDPRTTDIGLDLNVLSYKSNLDGELQEVNQHKEIIAHILQNVSDSPSIDIIPPPNLETRFAALWARVQDD